MSIGVINFIGSAFFGAGSNLIGVKSALAVAVLSVGVVLRVDRAGHAVSIGNEVIVGASLARSAEKTESGVALA